MQPGDSARGVVHRGFDCWRLVAELRSACLEQFDQFSQFGLASADAVQFARLLMIAGRLIALLPCFGDSGQVVVQIG